MCKQNSSLLKSCSQTTRPKIYQTLVEIFLTKHKSIFEGNKLSKVCKVKLKIKPNHIHITNQL